MKRRSLNLIEEPDQKAGGRLLERGSWVAREEESGTLVFAQLSYLAAQIWRDMLWKAVDVFIEDNRQTCTRCSAEWITLKEGPGEHCVGCGAG